MFMHRLSGLSTQNTPPKNIRQAALGDLGVNGGCAVLYCRVTGQLGRARKLDIVGEVELAGYA
jgi:hypothetical protein